MIGLSGLITPSLDEMVVRGAGDGAARLTLPLLIGGATTSRQHTAVKIAPEYSAADRPRARRLARRGRRGSPDERERAAPSCGATARSRTRSARNTRRGARSRCSPTSRRGPTGCDRLGRPRHRSTPAFVGRRYLDDVPLAEMRELHRLDVLLLGLGAEGALPGDPRAPAVRRRGARALRQRAGAAEEDRGRQADPRPRRLRLLAGGCRRRRHRALQGRGSAARSTRGSRCCGSRSAAGRSPNSSLADFVAPRGSGVPGHLGMFAVTGGLGAEELAKRFEADHDDYSAIMVKALADRLAEAFATYLHAASATTGAIPIATTCRRGSAPGEAPRHPSRRPAIRRARITAGSSICSAAAGHAAGHGADRARG